MNEIQVSMHFWDAVLFIYLFISPTGYEGQFLYKTGQKLGFDTCVECFDASEVRQVGDGSGWGRASCL